MTTTSERLHRSNDAVEDPILEVKNASVTFDGGETYVLDDVTFSIERNEILGVVGESGSGKSMLASALLDAIPAPGHLSGEVLYHPDQHTTVDILEFTDDELME